jgi:hypothetical protein
MKSMNNGPLFTDLTEDEQAALSPDFSQEFKRDEKSNGIEIDWVKIMSC